MANENEKVVEETLENKAEEIVENKEEKKESVAAENEGKTTQEQFISEFAPEPIKIPNYNQEKELKKRVKESEKKKKSRSKKNKKKRRIIRKAVIVVRNIVLFAVLLTVIAATISTLFVKMNTSEYAVRKAIRDANPETFVVGEVKAPEKINLRESAKKASIADVLRDNAMYPITYADIQSAVARSTYPDFVADIAHEVMSHYIFGSKYDGVTAKEIEKTIFENVSHIKVITNIELGESACREISEYMMRSAEFKALSVENVQKQKAGNNTYITSTVFSTAALICYVIALLLFMILTVIFCKGFAYKMIGWATIISGVFGAIAGLFVSAGFDISGEFVKSVIDAIMKSFHQNAIVFGVVTVLVGVLIILIGSAAEEDDDDDEYEEFEEVEEALVQE